VLRTTSFSSGRRSRSPGAWDWGCGDWVGREPFLPPGCKVAAHRPPAARVQRAARTKRSLRDRLAPLAACPSRAPPPSFSPLSSPRAGTTCRTRATRTALQSAPTACTPSWRSGTSRYSARRPPLSPPERTPRCLHVWGECPPPRPAGCRDQGPLDVGARCPRAARAGALADLLARMAPLPDPACPSLPTPRPPPLPPPSLPPLAGRVAAHSPHLPAHRRARVGRGAAPPRASRARRLAAGGARRLCAAAGRKVRSLCLSRLPPAGSSSPPRHCALQQAGRCVPLRCAFPVPCVFCVGAALHHL
jgi:hypothetical protein